jgi:hypothetical protein
MTTKALIADQISFEIGNRSGEADATNFITTSALCPDARVRALDALGALVAARFTTLTMTWEQPKGDVRRLKVKRRSLP